MREDGGNAHDAGGGVTTIEVLTWVVNALFVLASVATLRLWIRHRSRATAWLLATFVVFDLSIATSLLPESALDDGVPQRLVVVLTVASPYLLYRFADAVVAGPVWLRRVAAAGLAAVAALTLLLPELPSDANPEMGALGTVWFVAVLVLWGGLDVTAGGMLVRASIGEPGVVRNRLRVLAVAAIGLGLLIPISALVLGDDPSSAAEVVNQLVALVLAVLFLVGFAPPGLLKAAWREQDERRLYEAAVGLMGARRPEDVARVLVPGARALMGAPAVTMRASDGEVMARSGPDVDELTSVREVRHRAIGPTELEVVVAPTMPLFGTDEAHHLDRLALLAELALDRVRLLDAERRARDDVERLNGELEAFVYTTSHDLKNPLIAMIGYLDVLAEDHAHAFQGEVGHIFERMQVNARHMDSLIRDLLELSRVGRIDVTPERVDLALLVDDLARDVAAGRRGMQVQRGDLPVLWMNGTRARQLLTNLLDNARAYGGRDDVTVTVLAEPLDGGVRIVVRDDGVGIAEEHLERVFDVFERLAPEGPGGTGMGLAICRRVVEHVGGSMRAVPSDVGACFQIDLPEHVLHVDAPEPTPLEGSTP
jgi:signal transduction histidine kinase